MTNERSIRRERVRDLYNEELNDTIRGYGVVDQHMLAIAGDAAAERAYTEAINDLLEELVTQIDDSSYLAILHWCRDKELMIRKDLVERGLV